MSRTNETHHMSRQETCSCKCRSNASVCNDKHHCNNDKCRCKCKESSDKGRCDDRFIWKPSMYKCECDKSCDVGEDLDYANCKCRKRLIDKSILPCKDKILNTTDTISIADKKITCKNNCLTYIILLTIICLIQLAIVSISCYYYYTRYWLKKVLDAILNIYK